MVETQERIGYEFWLWKAAMSVGWGTSMGGIEKEFKERFPGNYTVKITIEKGTVKADMLFDDKHEQLLWMLKYE